MSGVTIDIVSASLVFWLAVAIHSRQGPSELRRALLLTQLAALLFITGDLGTLMADDAARESVALTVLYAGTMALPPCLLLLARAFADSHERRPEWVPMVAVRAAFVLAFAFWVVAASNPWHGQFLTPVMSGRNEHHWLWWVASSVSYVVVCAAISVCVWLGRRRDIPWTVRIQSAVLASAMAIPIVANGIYNLTSWSSPVDPSVPAFSVTIVLVAISIHGIGLFGLSPVSMREALLATPEAVLVVDPMGRERVANAAARDLMKKQGVLPSVDAVGRLAARLMHAETDDAVAGSELWAIARAIPAKRAGVLYRARLGGHEPERWLWLTSVPIPSRWREVAAYCFRATDVTALEKLRRDNAALVRRANRVKDVHPTPARRVAHVLDGSSVQTQNWQGEILRRLEGYEVMAVPGINARRVGATLDAILSDHDLVKRFERASSEEVWREFERRLVASEA